MRRALLLSGGIDSIAVCFWRRPEIAITVDYGQRAAIAEIHAATQVTRRLSLPHIVISADCSSVGCGTMSMNAVTRQPSDFQRPTEEWWPYRNQLLATLAAGFCAGQNIDCLLLGTVATDVTHRDGTQEFYDALNALLAIQEGGLRVEAPAIQLTSAELIEKSQVPIGVLAWAHSCHRANLPCGQCRGCLKHQQIAETMFPLM